MQDNLEIVSGEFVGNFYTIQKAIISALDSTLNKNHQVNLYRGEVSNVRIEEKFLDNEIKNRDSILLHNVSNIQLCFDDDNKHFKIVNFQELLLINPIVNDSWEINGKTYGIIKSKVIGKIKTIKNNNESTNKVITTIDQETTLEKKVDNITNEINNKDNPDVDFKNLWQNFNVPNNDINIENKTGCLPIGSEFLTVGKGCFLFGIGCLNSIWKFLLFLISIFFLIWLLKSCFGKNIKNQNCCTKNDSLVSLINELRDSLNVNDIQSELDNLSSKIYFFGDSTGIRNSNIDKINKIVGLLNKHKKYNVLINGYMNNTINKKIENNNLDFERAKAIEKALVKKGIDQSRLTSKGMGISKLYPFSVYDSALVEGRYLKYNKNMRVEIKIIN